MEVARKREHKSAMEIAKFYTDAFFVDFEKVNCRMPEIVSPATDNISEYIKIITKLMDTDYAYQSGGNVYFDISKLDNYYCLTNQDKSVLICANKFKTAKDILSRIKLAYEELPMWLKPRYC